MKERTNDTMTLQQLRDLNLGAHKRKWNGPYQGEDTKEWKELIRARNKAHYIYKAAMLSLSKEFEINAQNELVGRREALALYTERKLPIEKKYEKALLEARGVFNRRNKK